MVSHLKKHRILICQQNKLMAIDFKIILTMFVLICGEDFNMASLSYGDKVMDYFFTVRLFFLIMPSLSRKVSRFSMSLLGDSNLSLGSK